MTAPRTSYVIESSKNLPLLLRLRDIVLTILVWAMYLYFMKDFFAFMGDVFAWGMAGFGPIDDYPSLKIIYTFITYIEISAVLGVLFIGWSAYNILRYGNKKRRRAATPVTPENLAALYDLDVKDIEHWQDDRILVMHHDKDGRLVDVVKN